MLRSSRRTFIAATGGLLSVGCIAPGETDSNGPGGESAFDGPAPLGFEAVPESVPDPPAFEAEWVSESEVARGIVDIVDEPNGWQTLTFARSSEGYEPAEIQTLSADGEVTASRTLDAVPSNKVWYLDEVDENLVAGGDREQDDQQASWLRGVDSEFAFDTDWQTVYSGVTVDDDSLFGAGTLWYEGDSGNQGAVCHRIGPDGSVTWEQTVDQEASDTRFWSVTTTPDGVLAGGSNDNDMWLVSYAEDGGESWRRRIAHDEEAYDVDLLTSGSTGTYAVAMTNQFAQGNNHAMLLSLGAEGTIEWARVFDPNFEEYSEGPLNLYVRDIVDAGGPVLAGHTDNRAWMAATDPDGTMRWAGYYPESRDSRTVRSFGLATADEGVVVYGSSGDRMAESPWLARFES